MALLLEIIWLLAGNLDSSSHVLFYRFLSHLSRVLTGLTFVVSPKFKGKEAQLFKTANTNLLRPKLEIGILPLLLHSTG